MINALLARLAARVVLVGGKGGVGKTTTAGAIALAFADRGEIVHLISTDPAHSLRDLFGSLPQSCADNLTVEEFDAHAYAEAWFARVRPALLDLLEQGSYLDKEDAQGFLDLSLPGMDEVMAALRLADLLKDFDARIIVDTAPTGHTLRLLDAAGALRSWIGTGRALAAKATAVAEQLLRQPVRLSAENALDEIEAAAARFERDVLQHGAFVIVTRSGSVVEAESRRLHDALKQRSVQVQAVITDQPRATSFGDAPVFVAPRLQTTVGCEALREWAARLGEPATTETAKEYSPQPGNARSFIDALRPRILWVAGKGGVGKSTCAAALAVHYAQQRNVCVVSTDPAGSLSEIFQTEVTRSGVRLHDRLFAIQIDAGAELEQLRNEYRARVEEVFASLGLDRAARLDRAVLESLFDLAPPGIDEIVALIEIVQHVDRYDITVIDSAPTGHFLRLLEMPDIALDWVHALMRVMLKYRAAGSLDALGRDLLALAKRLRQLKTDLSAPDVTALFVVTLAEPMVLAETNRLLDQLESMRMPIRAVICNRAEVGRARALRSDHPAHTLMRAPDAGALAGTRALQAFLNEWELIGE